MKSNALGKDAELRAQEFLKSSGLEIISTNYHSRFGEVDIIAKSPQTLHFIEVKATLGNYDPLERITPKKIQKIVKTINYFLLKNDISQDFQIDAIIIQNNSIEWIKNISY